jgi:hypothetical protein
MSNIESRKQAIWDTAFAQAFDRYKTAARAAAHADETVRAFLSLPAGRWKDAVLPVFSPGGEQKSLLSLYEEAGCGPSGFQDMESWFAAINEASLRLRTHDGYLQLLRKDGERDAIVWVWPLERAVAG